MNTRLLIVYIAALCLASAGYVMAHEGEDHDEMEESKVGQGEILNGSVTEHNISESSTSGTEHVNNKICPVSGEGVYEMGDPVQYEYNGKIYNFCCKMCLKDFKKDPEKFSKIAEEEAKNNQ